MSSFNEMDTIVLTALGATTEQVSRLAAMGINTKQAVAALGNGATLTAMAGIDTTAATNILAWASIDLEGDDDGGAQQTADAYTPQQIAFEIAPLEDYTSLINGARSENEINSAHEAAVSEIYGRLSVTPSDTNEIYNFGRSLSIMLEPALDKINTGEAVSAEAAQLLSITESYFKKAIEMFNGFGRARIMYAYLLCMQKRFQETIDIVEPALTLQEGGQDWMTAAYWYLFAKASVGDTYANASEVYLKFKAYAAPGSREERFVENTLVHYFE
ncbi:hypothetical protein ACFQZJ_08340 [Maribacter chungangensis]|uniref:Tetratricopeptide repeat protein n=1 Tax=Maribacter chungangensis TaxID=1069117 RepID=A0ABW3B3L3_9FLAO